MVARALLNNGTSYKPKTEVRWKNEFGPQTNHQGEVTEYLWLHQ